MNIVHIVVPIWMLWLFIGLIVTQIAVDLMLIYYRRRILREERKIYSFEREATKIHNERT